MFRYYLGIAVFCLILVVMALFLADVPAPLAVIYGALACALVVIGFITAGQKSRW